MREGLECALRASGRTAARTRPGAPRWLRVLAAAIFLAGLLSAAAPPPSIAADEPIDIARGDPLEPLNRFVFAFNEALDTFLLRPAAVIYGIVVPAPARRGVRNVVRHLSLPFTFMNDIAQGKWKRSGDTAKRFIINTTIGFAGLHDAAKDYGLPHRSTDFGSTLATWGIGDGPYLVLPLAGPSSLRDAAGLLVQGAADPVDVAFRRVKLDHWPLMRAGAATLDFRHRNLEMLDDIKTASLDYYTFIRTLYRQRRAFEVDGDRELFPEGDKENMNDDYTYPPPRPDFSRGERPAASPPAQ